MGDANSKGFANSFEGSSQMLQKAFSESGKYNVIVMNPEIHLHGSHQSTSIESSMNEARVKKLQEEYERQLRESEERRRHAESLRSEQLLRQKEFRIRYQSEVLSRQVELLNKYKSHLEEVDMNKKAFHQTDQQNQRKRETKHYGGKNRFFNRNVSNRRHHYDGQRSRSKTEFNFENDPMELWEWNGTKWVLMKDTQRTHNNQQIQSADPSVQVFESAASSDVDVLTNDTSSIIIPQRNVVCQPTITSTSQTTNVLSTEAEQTRPSELLVKDPLNSTQVKNTEVIHLDDTDVEQTNQINSTVLNLQYGACNSYPRDVSISFDEHELRDYSYWEDVSLFAMPKRVKRSN